MNTQPASEDCRDLRDLIHLVADRRADFGLWLRVHRHVRTCSDCRAELSDLRRLGREFQRLPRVAAPAGFDEAVRGRLRATQPSWSPLPESPSPAPWRALIVEAAVAAVLVAGSATWVTVHRGWQPLARTAQAAEHGLGAAANGMRQAWAPAPVQVRQARQAAIRDWHGLRRFAAVTVHSLGDLGRRPAFGLWPAWLVWSAVALILILNLWLEVIPRRAVLDPTVGGV